MVSLPRGMRDRPPSEAISIRETIAVIEEVFKRFGFSPLETPAVENLDVLNAKTYGQESPKELFRLEGEDSALRYDLTVPLARYVAMNKELPLPFKRYQIGSIWRKEEPQRMRYREFMQADVDIVGADSESSDAETIAACAVALDELELKGYSIHLNSRVLLQKVLELFEVPADKQVAAIRTIDKMQKVSRDVTQSQLASLGIPPRKCGELLDFMGADIGGIDGLSKLAAGMPAAKDEVARLGALAESIRSYGIKGKVVIDLSLARGIDYYTGFVWEFVVEQRGARLPSVCSGGRYDKLIGLFAGRDVPATGSSIGISRVIDALDFESKTSTYAKVFVAYIGKNEAYALEVATKFRSEGIYTDLNVMNRNLSKQLSYASGVGMKYVVIVGDKEREMDMVRVRDMTGGDEEDLSIGDAINKIKG